MIASPCPACGKPARLCVMTPDAIRCSACGFHGAVPADAAARLAEAARVLRATDVRARQLSAKFAESLARAGWYQLRFLLMSAFVLVPTGLFVAFCVFAWAITEAEMARLFLVPVLPYLVMLGVTWLGHRWVKDRSSALVEKVSAVPPGVPGEPAACHVCGGDLEHRDVYAIVRCRFCQSDNVVDPAALARAHHRDAIVMGDIAKHVAQRTSGVSSASGAGALFVLVAAGASPVVGFASLFVLAGLQVAILSRLPADGVKRYAVVKTSSGMCAGSVARRDDGSVEVDFGANKLHQGKMSMVLDRASAGQVVSVDATWFHGKRVRLGASGDVGVVKGSHAGMFGNVIEIQTPKETRGIVVPGVCLAP